MTQPPAAVPDPAAPADRLTLTPVVGLAEVEPGTDLAVLLGAVAGGALADGDVLVVTSKVVSKAEGRTRTVAKTEAVQDESDRVVARRGPTEIVRTRHGLVLAGAGVDASNTAVGTVVLLPEDPDASARHLREAMLASTGRNVAVVVTDTAGRAWRTGQTDIAVGAAGLPPLVDLAGHVDGHGNRLTVTAPALADEVAAAADLVKGKLAGRPAAVLRGLGHVVLPAGEHGPGAAALVRPEAQDMFGLGARDAVLAALTARPGEVPRGFGGAATADEVAAALAHIDDVTARVSGPGTVEVSASRADDRAAGRTEARLETAALALGWVRVPPGDLTEEPPSAGHVWFRLGPSVD